MRIFATEQISKYHPDKFADKIADTIVTELLRKDENNRAGIEVTVKDYTVVLSGEVRTSAKIDYAKIAKKVAKELGYKVKKVINLIGVQSEEIFRGTTEGDKMGAGDQGLVFGYATRETESYLPFAFDLANKIIAIIEKDVKENTATIFKGDAKTQVMIDVDRKQDIKAVQEILISACHRDTVPVHRVRERLEYLTRDLLKGFTGILTVNPAGAWSIGGPVSDTGLCLAKGTLIATKQGLIPIQTLKIGQQVYTESGTAEVVETYDNGIKPTLVIEDERGLRIEATHNHPFRTLNRETSTIKWTNAGNLKVGDILVSKRQRFLTKDGRGCLAVIKYKQGRQGNSRTIKVNADFAYLLGWLVGDGTIGKEQEYLSFYYNSTSSIEKEHLYSSLLKVFNKEEILFYKYQNDRFTIASKTLIDALINQLGVSTEKQPTREIPSIILKSSDRIKAAFLSGLFDSDGTIQTGGGRNGEYIKISLATSSNILAQQVAVLLYHIGITSKISTTKRGAELRETGQRKGTFFKAGTFYQVAIAGWLSISRFLTLINFSLSTKKYSGSISNTWHYKDYQSYPLTPLINNVLLLDTSKKTRYFSGLFRQSKINDKAISWETVTHLLDLYKEFGDNKEYAKLLDYVNNFEFYKIASIKGGEATTYDITLNDDTHSFVANGFIVHNTGRKIVCDQTGGFAPVGGGALSGKSVDKVDRSGTYMARRVAIDILKNFKNVEYATVQLSYAIGVEQPTGVWVKTNLSSKQDIEFTKWVRKNYDLTPRGIINHLDLYNRDYGKMAEGCHFREVW